MEVSPPERRAYDRSSDGDDRSFQRPLELELVPVFPSLVEEGAVQQLGQSVGTGSETQSYAGRNSSDDTPKPLFPTCSRVLSRVHRTSKRSLQIKGSTMDAAASCNQIPAQDILFNLVTWRPYYYEHKFVNQECDWLELNPWNMCIARPAEELVILI